MSFVPDLDESTDSPAIRRLALEATGTAPHESTSTTSCYVMSGFEREPEPELVARLGKYETGKACLDVKRLVDVDALEERLRSSVEHLRAKYPA